MATAMEFLSTYIEPLAEELTPGQAQKILAVKPTDALVARIQELADKANDGTFTEQERAEYEHFVGIDDVIGLLKAKARSLLNDLPSREEQAFQLRDAGQRADWNDPVMDAYDHYEDHRKQASL